MPEIFRNIRTQIYQTLRWSEKYTKTDMVYLTKGGFWLTTGKVVGLATSLATSIVFANLLSEHTYGVYRYVLSIMALLVIPTLGGIDNALTRAVARGYDNTFFSALKEKMKWGVIGSVASVALASYYFFQGNETLGSAFLLAALFIPIMDPANLFAAFLAGKKDFKKQAFYQVCIRILSALLIIGTVFVTTNIIFILGIYFLSYTVLRLIFLFAVHRNVDKTTLTEPEALTYGKHLTAISIPSVIAKTLDAVLIFHFLGGAALAGYYLALIPFKQVQTGLRGLNVLALPNFSKSSAEILRKTVPRKVALLYLPVTLIFFAYWIIAPFAFDLVYPKYADFAALSVIFMVQLFFFPVGILNTAITAQGDHKKLYGYSISYACIRIVLLLILVPIFGIWGAAAAILTAGILGSFLTLFLFFRLH